MNGKKKKTVPEDSQCHKFQNHSKIKIIDLISVILRYSRIQGVILEIKLITLVLLSC